MDRDMVNKIIFVLFFIAGISYVILGNDLIPDNLSALPINMLTGFIDDAVVIITLIFTFRKIRNALDKSKKTQKGKKNWQGTVWMLLLLGIVLFYVFWGVDIIPDNIAGIGHLDDIIVTIVAGTYLLAKLRQQAFPKG